MPNIGRNSVQATRKRIGIMTASVSVALLTVVLVGSAAETRGQENTSLSSAAVQSALEAIRPQAIEAHIRFLADDLLEGRAPGNRGFELASRYVETQFRALGLQPAGVGGGFSQPVPLRESLVVEEQSHMTLERDGSERILVYAEDYLLSPSSIAAETEVSGPLAFVGYGVVASELGHDDYAGIDVDGKVVAYLSGAPKTFPSNQRAYYSSRFVKYEEALARGALAVISFTSPDDPASAGR